MSSRPFATVLALLGLVSGIQAAGPRPPTWRPGQRWTVSVTMETRQVVDTAPGAVAPPGYHGWRSVAPVPKIWHFEVVEMFESDDGGIRRHRVHARRSGTDAIGAELIFVSRLEEGRPVARALQSVRLPSEDEAYTRDLRTMSPEPIPGLLTGTQLPLSYPYLAPDVPARRKFEITEVVGKLPFAMDVEQQVLSGKEASREALRLGIKAGERPVWVVRLRRATDRQYADQVWFEGDPWPARVVANHTASTLLGTGAGG